MNSAKNFVMKKSETAKRKREAATGLDRSRMMLLDAEGLLMEAANLRLGLIHYFLDMAVSELRDLVRANENGCQ